MELDDQEKTEQYDGFFGDDCIDVSARQKCLWELNDNISASGMFFWFGLIMLLPTAIVSGATILAWRRMRPTTSSHQRGRPKP